MQPALILGLAAAAMAADGPLVWQHDERLFQHEATQFDYYVFAHSWQASFCYKEPYPGCKAPNPYWKTHFTVHGLWPELNEGPHPGYCSKEPLDMQRVRKAIGQDTLEKFWPNVKVAINTTGYDSFWNHEWTRHGTCSGLDQVTFFQSAIERMKTQGTPDFISQSVGKVVATSAIRDAYGGPKKVVLQCKNQRLSQVYTCLGKDKDNKPTDATECSSQVLKEDNCRVGEILIPAF
ncbi:hypothetical protein SDRG_13546 [Saprolegnia diclina VS20]|uniref:Uncharacterized protein n=1 Tax=Saprolegnia diclina (strain VS20) TaxID=1156394 RepID=T0PT29_SAPDV|nr:hypothetical protein SDRG_13546 [Saprolegnia diclina VS20]EQC28669.1 hypothetical protein SDRG_13546 [Saprolegnia diclina VS20]|eukprot:XP_008617861.1 hypothetical protein SDRG_13546 [Saprolegnia diclina VS20]